MEPQPRQIVRVSKTGNRSYASSMSPYVLRSDQKVISAHYLVGSGNSEELVLIIEEDVPVPPSTIADMIKNGKEWLHSIDSETTDYSAMRSWTLADWDVVMRRYGSGMMPTEASVIEFRLKYPKNPPTIVAG